MNQVRKSSCPYCGATMILPFGETFKELTYEVNQNLYNKEGNRADEETNYYSTCVDCSGLYKMNSDGTATKPSLEELVNLKADPKSAEQIERDKERYNQ